jgi:hypothetical protein
MHLVAQESARLSRSNSDNFHMGGTGHAPQLNHALKGNAWVEPSQPARPQSYDKMRVKLPAEVAPQIEMPPCTEVEEINEDLDDELDSPMNVQRQSMLLSTVSHSHLVLAPRASHAYSDDDNDSDTGRKSARAMKGSQQNRKLRGSNARKSVFGAPPEGHEGPKAVFADANAMKEKVRMAVMVQEYNVCDFYWETGICQVIARSHVFEYFTLAVIAFNALWISIDTDNNEALTLADASPVFQIAENAFCVYFSFEWFVRFCSFREKRNCLKDAWFVFDSALVTLMVGETWVMNLILLFAAGGGASGGAMGNTSVLKLFRLVLLTRMARMAKLLRAIPELIILIKGIAVASRSVVFTLMLLGVILYFFAIVFRQLTDDTELGQEFPISPRRNEVTITGWCATGPG